MQALFDATLATLRAQGATLVDIKETQDHDKLGPAELTVLLTELKVDMAKYLATTNRRTVPTRTLADLIAFNRAHAGRELALFGQDSFEKAEATGGLDDPAYKAARALSLRLAGRDGIDRMLAADRLDALVAPTMPPAWKTDAVNGDGIAGSGPADLAAVAGYPHLSVPMGQVRGLPVGLSIVGPAWSEARLLALGYAFEQARGPLPPAARLPSVEAEPAVAQLLAPAAAIER